MLKRLGLRNFKCFGNAELEFGKLTLLTGLNGMGKSSVLQALLSLRQTVLKGEHRMTNLELDGEYVQLGSAGDVLYELADTDEMGLSLHFNGQGHDRVADFNFLRVADRDVFECTHGPKNKDVAEEPLFADDMRYLTAERIGPRNTYPISESRVRKERDIGIRGEYTAQFLAVYGTTEVPPALRHGTAASASLMSQTKAWLGLLSPGTELDASIHSERVASIAYTFPLGAGMPRSKQYRPTSVGFGISYVLPVIVSILSSGIGSILAIENPEAHLHPRGQSMLGKLLAMASANGCQCIIETHSDHLVNGARVAIKNKLLHHDDARVYYFEQCNTSATGLRRIQEISVGPTGRMSRWPEGFFDEWDRNLEELLS